MRQAIVCVLLLGSATLSVCISHAQQPASTPRPSDRPIKVKMVGVPFGQYRYRLAAGPQGRYFAGFSQMLLNHSDANEPPPRPAEKPPGRVKYDAITLERGVTHDNSFAQWANKAPGQQELRDMAVDIFNEAGQKSATHKLTGCVVAEYQSLPNLDGGANNIAIEHIQLRCRGVK